MVISTDSPHIIAPLLQQQQQQQHDDIVAGAADYRGRAVQRSSSGGWRSAIFVLGVEVAERFAYYGASSNLISYLTEELGESTATAAENVNAWSGTALMLPLVGAFVADSFLGRYRTIVFASLVYILGLGLLTLSAILLPLMGSSSQELQVVLFFISLYLVALGQGGHKPCVQAFGADQFDDQDPHECKAKSSFFNWWNFGLNMGIVATLIVVNYVQEYLSWGLGFGIPCTAMLLSLLIFLLGTKTYRYSLRSDEKNPFLKVGLVFVTAIRNWRTTSSALAIQEEANGTLPSQNSEQFKFLNKALVATKEDGTMCSVSDVEDAKSILRLVPIWTTCLVYGIVYAQPATFFTKQGATMDRTIAPGFTIPAASLQSCIALSIIVFIAIYDRIFVPIARTLTGKPSGITMLQRIGAGLFLNIISMVVAALVEVKRLKTAKDYGLVDTPNATIPMSIWWLVPQYMLCGIVDVLAMVGLQELFYDQVPDELRSVGLSLYLSILGIGSFLSSFMVSVIERATSGDGRESWFANNLNKAHLDYYYLLLAGISFIGFVLYLFFAKSYIYKRKTI